jgi:hypothetical protein
LAAVGIGLGHLVLDLGEYCRMDARSSAAAAGQPAWGDRMTHPHRALARVWIAVPKPCGAPAEGFSPFCNQLGFVAPELLVIDILLVIV